MSNAKVRHRRQRRRHWTRTELRKLHQRGEALYRSFRTFDTIAVAMCIRCGGTFPLCDLTQAYACSYLCLPCAERIEAEIAAL